MITNPLPGVPTVESPFFEQLVAHTPLTDDELRVARDLRTNGFAVIDFPDPDIANKADAIKNALHHRYPWDKWQTGDADMRIQDAWSFDENVHSIATNPTITNLLGKLYGRRAWPFQSLNFPVGTQQHFHTDSIHFSSVPERFMCGVWVALEDIDEDQGPLEYYPGSHKWPIYTNEHIGFLPRSDSTTQETYHLLWEQLVHAAGVQREIFCPRKGQALIWAANLLHGGMRHKDKSRTRWSQVTHYYFENCAYFTPMLSDPFRGLIKFRKLTDLTTMQPAANRFSGEAIPEVFLAAATRGFHNVLAIRRSTRGKSLLQKLSRLKNKLGL